MAFIFLIVKLLATQAVLFFLWPLVTVSPAMLRLRGSTLMARLLEYTIFFLSAGWGIVISKAMMVTLQQHPDWWHIGLYFMGLIFVIPISYLIVLLTVITGQNAGTQNYIFPTRSISFLLFLIGYFYGVWGTGYMLNVFKSLSILMSV